MLYRSQLVVAVLRLRVLTLVEVNGCEGWTVGSVGIRSVDLVFEALILCLIAHLSIVAIERTHDSRT